MDFPEDGHGEDGQGRDGDRDSPFEGTRVDLGDDLVERTAVLIPFLESDLGEEQAPARDGELLDTSARIEDNLESARILMTEGLLDESKRILRRIILADPRHLIARRILDEIHDLELKQIFGEGRPSRGSVVDDEDFDTSPMGSELVMRQLDRDLRLGVFGEGGSEDALTAALSLFQSREELDAFGVKLERDLAGSSARDRLDTGIAFLEMGLYDVATRLLRMASRDPEQRFAGTGLLAYALILGGRPFEATQELEAVLGDSELPREEKVDFMYLMARAYEGLDNRPSAFQWYQRIQEAEPHYRDTDERMDGLARQLGRPSRPR